MGAMRDQPEAAGQGDLFLKRESVLADLERPYLKWLDSWWLKNYPDGSGPPPSLWEAFEAGFQAGRGL